MQKNTLFDSNLSTDSFTKINEYEGVGDFSNLLSFKLPSYIPSYHESIHSKSKEAFSKTSENKPKKTSNKSLDQRHFKINFERPDHKIMGDVDNILNLSSISDIYLKSSGILAHTLMKSKYLPNSINETKLSEIEFLDVESQFPNSNSLYFDNIFNEINVISSILIKNNKESYDFPRKHFNLKQKTFKIDDKEFGKPYDLSQSNKKPSMKINIDDLDKILDSTPKFIGNNEINKILDYFNIKEAKKVFFPKENSNESFAIDPLFSGNNSIVTEEEQLYEILNNSNEKSFELPVISSAKTCQNKPELTLSDNFLEENGLKLTTHEENIQLPSPKFIENSNISDSLEIENIISKNSMIDDTNNLYFSFAEIIHQDFHNDKRLRENKNNISNDKMDSFEQYFFQNKSSFHSFYESIVHQNNPKSSALQKNKRNSFLDSKENKNFERNSGSYIQKIISTTNSKKKTESSSKQKENQKKSASSNKRLLEKDKGSLNFKKNKNPKVKFEEIR